MASVSWEAYGGARQTHRRLMNVPQGSPLIDTVDAWHRQRAALAVGWALELEKLVCGERVPFAALRTPEGAHLWHLEPQAFTARAIRKLRDRAASFR